MTNNYPHINTLKSIDDFKKFAKKFNKCDYDNIFIQTYSQLNTVTPEKKILNSIFRVCLPILALNVSNIIFTHKFYPKNFKLIKFKNEDFSLGKRSLGGNYLIEFYKNQNPIIDPFIKGLFYPNLKESLKHVFSLFFSRKNIVFSQNDWLMHYLKKEKIPFVKVSQDYFWDSKNNPNINISKINSENYKCLFISIIEALKNSKQLSDTEIESIKTVVDTILNFTYRDFINCNIHLKKKKKLPKKIFVGTSGGYLTRIVLENLKLLGTDTYATLHSGTIAIFDYKFDQRKFIEFMIPKNFIVSSKEEMKILKKKYGIKNLPNIISINTNKNEIQRTSPKAKILSAKKIKKIIYVSPNFSGHERYGVLNEFKRVLFEYALLKYLCKAGYDVTYKVHPKGIKFDNSIFDIKELKFSSSPIKELTNTNSIFIFNLIDSTAFNEVSGSNCPSIVISESQKQLLLEEPLKILEKRVGFVELLFNKNNEPKINTKQLIYCLNRDYIINDDFKNIYQ